MARTESKPVRLGTSAPNFELLDARDNRIISLNDKNVKKGLVIAFMCNHCPFVKHILPEFNDLAGEYIMRDVSFIGINSNDADAYPEDSFEKMEALVEEYELSFPYVHDKDQEAARAYGAACTPDIFVYDSKYRLVYHGQFDDSRPGNDVPVTGDSLRRVLDDLIKGRPISEEQRPSVGCNIKWKKA